MSMRLARTRSKRPTHLWMLAAFVAVLFSGLFAQGSAPAAANGGVLEMSVSVTTDIFEGTPLTVGVRLVTDRLSNGSGTVRVEDRTTGTRVLGSVPIVDKRASIAVGTLSVGTHRLAVVYVSTAGNQTMTALADVRILATPPPTTTSTTTTIGPTTAPTTPTTAAPTTSTTVQPVTTTIGPPITAVRPTTAATNAQSSTTQSGTASSVARTTTTAAPRTGATTATSPTARTDVTSDVNDMPAVSERSTDSTIGADPAVSASAIPASVGADPATNVVLPTGIGSTATSTTVPPDGVLDITLEASVGDLTSSTPVLVQGLHVAPNSAVTVTLHSTPVVLATLHADGSGSFSQTVVLPANIEPGDHRLIVSGTARSGAPLQAIAPFTVLDGRFTAIGRTTRAKVLGASTPAAAERSRLNVSDAAGTLGPAAMAGPLPAVVPSLYTAGGGQYAVLSTEARSKQVIDSQIDLFTLLAILSAAAAPSVAARVAKDAEDTQPNDKREAYSREEVVLAEAVPVFASGSRGLGDESNTWALLGTESFDEATKSVPHRVGRFSPLLARVFADGVYLRAMFGGMWLIGPGVGLLIGEGAGLNGNGTFLPPATGWVIALLVVGLLDAFSGLIGAAAYLLTTIAIGGVPTGDGLRATLGLLTLWFGPILIAAAARPLRRLHPHDEKTVWERLTDGVMAPLFAAWGARGLASAQNGLSGLSLPIADAATIVGWVVAGVVLGRFLIESCAAYYYPERLSLTDSGAIATPDGPQALVSAAARAALFLFCATAIVPWGWQLMVALGIYLAQIALTFFAKSSSDRFPNSARIFRWTPAGLVRTLVLLVAGLGIAAWLGRQQPDSEQRMLDGMWLLALPGLVFAVLGVLGRKGERPKLRWRHRLLGIPLLALLVYLKF